MCRHIFLDMLGFFLQRTSVYFIQMYSHSIRTNPGRDNYVITFPSDKCTSQISSLFLTACFVLTINSLKTLK
jgi:hypothetical protein